jgi:hypothetical protein
VLIPPAAEVTPANVADNVLAPALLPELPAGLRFLLADVAAADSALRAASATGRAAAGGRAAARASGGRAMRTLLLLGRVAVPRALPPTGAPR